MVGSAQWRSSRQTSSGRSRASPSSTRLTPQNTSSLGTTRSESPMAAPTCSKAAPASSRSPIASEIAPSPPSSPTSSTRGQYVIPGPYGRQRPDATRAPGANRDASSWASLDLPIPAGPISETRPHLRSPNSRSIAALISSSSPTRPTRGASSRRAYPAAVASTSSRASRVTGWLFPLALNRSRGPTLTASLTSGYVAVPIRIAPFSAACSSRLARFTASPVTNDSPVPGSPATTSPVLMPMRQASSTPQVPRSSAFRSPRRRCISVPVRTARRASSSCTTGTPKTAMTSSPRNRSTVPPCSRTTSAIVSA